MIPAMHGALGSSAAALGSWAWWEADFGASVDGSNNLTAWADQSGNNRTYPVSTTGTHPQLLTNAVNGLPAWTYTNSRHVIDASTLSGSFWVITLVQFNTPATTSYLFDSNTSSNRAAFYANATGSNWEVFAGLTVQVGALDTAYNLHATKYRAAVATTSRYSKNGAIPGTTYDFGTNAWTTMNIGQRFGGTNPFSGHLAAFIVEPNDVRALDIIPYLKAKYAR